ncbi:MAG: histidine phosphatase family protein [Dehalococcoidia bacterium]
MSGEHHLTLHFVRHGETTWNAERRMQGQLYEAPLSDRGREQAHALAERLAGCGAEALISSDLLRALDTARIIGSRMGLEVAEEAALRERSFGVLQGRLYDDLERELGEELRRIWREPDIRPDEGESWRDVYLRAGEMIDRLREDPPAREMVLVTHGGTMNVALTYLAGLPLEQMEWRRFENCALVTVQAGPDGVRVVAAADAAS